MIFKKKSPKGKVNEMSVVGTYLPTYLKQRLHLRTVATGSTISKTISNCLENALGTHEAYTADICAVAKIAEHAFKNSNITEEKFKAKIITELNKKGITPAAITLILNKFNP